MVEVFKTNIDHDRASHITSFLLDRFPSFKVNFDLDDCDKILRVEGDTICAATIIELISERGFVCQALE